MFETAELGQKISKEEFKAREPVLREQLLEAQALLREANFPVVLVFAGVDGAGKGETANLLSEWMDPRGIETHAFSDPSDEERERPEYWRYWRALPQKGRIGVYLKSWYSPPLLGRVYRDISGSEFDDQLDRIAAFERTLADDGALILKFWMHLGQQAQKKRLKKLESDEDTRWRVTKRDWRHWGMYDKFMEAAERIITRTSVGHARWTIVEGADPAFRSLRVGEILLRALRTHLAETQQEAVAGDAVPPEEPPVTLPNTVLDRLDLTQTLPKEQYRSELTRLQGRLNLLHREARDRGISTVLVFEGWDAAGKGGAIRRITPALDARDVKIISIAKPTDEEYAHHYLWRFWRHLSRAGKVTIFDRSWYGRVLVERVEGFAKEHEWRRAYAEIRDFEQQLVDHGTVLRKFWVHITPEEQEERFRAREQTPYKRWKLTEEDWRNREKWADYELAVNAMFERTSTRFAPWVLVEGNDKRYARIKVLKEVCAALEEALG
jgi:polyphosphate:AMP phosphotransferase